MYEDTVPSSSTAIRANRKGMHIQHCLCIVQAMDEEMTEVDAEAGSGSDEGVEQGTSSVSVPPVGLKLAMTKTDAEGRPLRLSRLRATLLIPALFNLPGDTASKPLTAIDPTGML